MAWSVIPVLITVGSDLAVNTNDLAQADTIGSVRMAANVEIMPHTKGVPTQQQLGRTAASSKRVKGNDKS